MGDVVQVTLVFDDASEQQVTATVRQGEKMMEGHSHEMTSD